MQKVAPFIITPWEQLKGHEKEVSKAVKNKGGKCLHKA
jgi:hypothetical protein